VSNKVLKLVDLFNLFDGKEGFDILEYVKLDDNIIILYNNIIFFGI
jgi:hypothetical protein